MKVAAATIIAFAASTSAFTAAPAAKAGISLRMADIAEPMEPMEPMEPEEPSIPPPPEMSLSMPFMVRPAALDGELAGDVGFDPLGFAKTKADLMNFREAEIKHARLAMLAAAGWPLSELFDKGIAKFIGLNPIVDASDRAPSVLNGGLGKISPVFWVSVIIGSGLIEWYGLSQQRANNSYFPGKLNFDPLGLYGNDPQSQKRMELAEIKNGRLAMIAITAFAFQEFVSKTGVIDETPIFFKPLGVALHEYANTGYL